MKHTVYAQKKYIFILSFLLFISWGIYIWFRVPDDDELRYQGEQIVLDLEKYHSINDQYPITLEELYDESGISRNILFKHRISQYFYYESFVMFDGFTLQFNYNSEICTWIENKKWSCYEPY